MAPPTSADGAVAVSIGSFPATLEAARARRLAELGALAVMVAWSFNFVTVKAAISAVPPVGFAFVRFLLAGLPRRVAIRVGLLGGLGFGLYQLLWATALSLTTAGTSSLLVATTPIFTLLAAVATRAERGHRLRYIGAIVAFAGVALVAAGSGLRVDGAGLGDVMTIGAAACWGWYLALSAPLLATYSPLRLTTWAILAGTAVLAVPGLVELATGDLSAVGPRHIAAILYSGIVAGGLANVVLFRAIALLGPSRIANLQFLVPALTIVLAAILLGEPILAVQAAGLAVIVAGIIIARRAPSGTAAGRAGPEPPPLIEA
jgi:drug/metabolite transporter (DMT)-like permease